MNKYERYKDVPHFDLIKENAPVVIPSIFMFSSCDELYPFLAACKAFNSTLFFENEKMIISPHEEAEAQLKLLCYVTVMNCREVGDAYIRYLSNAERMKWTDNAHEAILEG